VRVSDDSVMQDATIETRDLHVSILCGGMSRLCVSHVVKEYRGFTWSGDKPRNKHYANMVEYSSEAPDDEEANMCVAEWNWASTSKPLICSSLKPTSKSRQDEMRYTFDVTKCDRIFDYLLQEKQIKLLSNHVLLLNN
jgi:hypothetical protein